MSSTQAKINLSGAQGQSLMEYLMIGAIITVASIALWLVVAGGLQNTLANLKGDMSATTVAAYGITASTNKAGYHGTSAGGAHTLTMEDGQVIHLSNYAPNIQAAIQTIGANGATKQVALSQAQIAKQLYAKGKITAAQYVTLTQLSMAAYQLAAAMALVENAADQAEAATQMAKMKIRIFSAKTGTYLSKQEKMDFIADQLSKSTATNQKGVVAVTALHTFAVLQQRVQNDPTLSQQLKYIVSQMSKAVKTLAIETGTDANQVIDTATQVAKNPSTNLNDIIEASTTVTDLSDSTDSTTVATEASHICVAGHWQDTGASCN